MHDDPMGGNVMDENEWPKIVVAVVDGDAPLPEAVHAVVVTDRRIECLPGCWGDDPHLSEYRAQDRRGMNDGPGPVVQLPPGVDDLFITGTDGTKLVRAGDTITLTTTEEINLY